MLRQQSTVFDAIAHPVRRLLLERLLETGEAWVSITELAYGIEMSRSTASRHLEILRRSGLVQAQSVDGAKLHRLHAPAFEPIVSWVDATAPRDLVGQPA